MKNFVQTCMLSVLAYAIFFCSPLARAETGFLDTPIWIRPEKPVEGEMVTLSAAFRNEEASNLSSTITFTDGTIVLGTKQLSLAPGALGTASVTFKISAGDHHFSASASNSIRTTSTGEKEPLTSTLSQAVLPKVSVGKKITTTTSVGIKTGEPVEVAASSILDHLPDSLKDRIVSTTAGLEEWRTNSYVAYQDKKEKAHASYADTKTSGKKAESSSVNGPLLYAKYILFTALAYLFSSAVGFYASIGLILFLVLRFVIRRARR